MGEDALSMALKARRGKGMQGMENNPMADQGFVDAPLPPGQNHSNEHTPVHGEDHLVGASTPQAPAMLAPVSAAQQLDQELHDGVTDGGTRADYDRMSGMPPGSLGQRAKFEALKKQFGGK